MLRGAVERATRLGSRLLSDDTVFAWVQRGLNSTLEARRLFDRNVGRILAGANIASKQDVDRLIDRVERIDRDLDDLMRRLERVKAKMGERR